MKQELLEAYNYRYACKEFNKEKKISDEDFNFILETGRLSPSSFGWEPWKFIVVQNEELRMKLKEYTWGAQGTLPTASHFVILAARKPADMKYDSEYLKYMSNDIQKLPEDIQTMKLDFFKNFSEKDFDMTEDRPLFDWASKQTYIPLGNMMTSAATLRIDSCPIEGFDRVKIDEILKQEGILDEHFNVSVMVAFGYRADNQEIFPKTRREQQEVVHWVK